MSPFIYRVKSIPALNITFFRKHDLKTPNDNGTWGKHRGSIGLYRGITRQELMVDVVNLHGQAVRVISDGTFRNVLVISSIVIFRILDSGVDEFRTISVIRDSILKNVNTSWMHRRWFLESIMGTKTRPTWTILIKSIYLISNLSLYAWEYLIEMK